MSRDADAKTDPKLTRLYDKRTVERNIKKGLLSRKDYDKHLKMLDDVADKGVYGASEARDDQPVHRADSAEDVEDADDAAEPEAPEPTDNQPG